MEDSQPHLERADFQGGIAHDDGARKKDSKAMSAASKINIDAIMEEIRANNKLLDSCPKPHKFERDPAKPLGKRTCKKCGGKIDGIHAIWYERGLKDADQN
jgi:hypothetical protein